MGDEAPVGFSRRRLLRWGALAAGAGLTVGLSARRGAAVTLSGVTAAVNVASLNVRSGPNSSSGIVGRLAQGTRVTCLATAGDWFQIRSGTLTGYVFSPYVTLVASSSAQTISRGSTARKLVSLTFDAGADRGYTVSILETLAAKGVKASFGLTGRWAAANKDLVWWITGAGHHLINHTWTHRSFTGFSTAAAALSPAARLEELERTESQLLFLSGLAGKPWFRPPYGDYDAGVLRDVAAAGFRTNVMWTVDSLGWNGLTANQIVSRVLNQHGNGYIYLLHVGAQSQDGPALPRIIDELRARGYGFATVPEILLAAAPAPTQTATPTATPTPTPAPTLTFTPTSGAPGSSVWAELTGYGANETVRITWYGWDGAPHFVTWLVVSAQGSGSVAFAAPATHDGAFTFEAMGQTRYTYATFTVVNPPTAAQADPNEPTATATPTDSPVTSDPATEAPPTATPTATTGAAPYPIVGSGRTEGSTSSALAYDGDPSTYWTTNEATTPLGAYLYVDLGAVVPIGAIDYLFAIGGGADRVQVQLSEAKVRWATITTLSAPPVGAWQSLPTPGQSGRYVRFSFTNVTRAPQLGGLAEVVIWP